ncbi:MAG: zf-HC2 domain-containing protein [Candidatus Aminicenantes bacterium]|jgi:anti-sigma factor RsiW|nr:zf-HC2 domain-containing protein [Candidatus Aminicenantes bacterium]
MKCRKAEKLISKLLDERLEEKSLARLEAHLKVCPSCARLLQDYKKMKKLMSEGKIESEPLPYFAERVKARLATESRPSIWAAAERWYAAAVPIFLVIATILVGALLLFQPSPKQYSQAEILLFQNQSPLKETQAIFEEEKPENRQLKLLFAGLESQETVRRGK